MTGQQAGSALLEVSGVSKAYRGVTALDAVSMRVERGSITGLIGPNGSGKSTLFDCITGFQAKDRGRVQLDGEDISALAPQAIARKGVRRTFQQLRFFPELTVFENLLVAAQSEPGFSFFSEIVGRSRVRAHEDAMRERAASLLEEIRLVPQAKALGASLSYGQKKLMELGMALMAQPRLLMVDEPMAGVNPTLIEGLKQELLKVRERGVALLIVEHNLKLVFEICDWIYVLDGGRLLAQGTPQEVAHDERVVQAYLGNRARESAID
jgi:ABC-type branched-subunit amino acid transport system ATPase component